jgi:peptidoglycan/xylan/chitin deacetylase (PgdA/CDA1 family)
MKSIKPKLAIHVDVDSPLKLIDFYQLKGVDFDVEDLELFYQNSWNRALEFFDRHNIKATFFVVGNELENNKLIKEIVLKAHLAGHEIENHTYSHPFGLASLPDKEIVEEIEKCNSIIKNLTGRNPIGFRSPGYSINSKIINLLQTNDIKYDSSGFWSVLNPILKISQKLIFKNGLKNEGFGSVNRRLGQKPYSPDFFDWQKKSKDNRDFWELPLPRTGILGLPFYNNFNLWTPPIYADFVSKSIKKPYLIYLFHIIEFMDLNDNIPEELVIHPNLKTPVAKKISRSEHIIINLLKRYELIKTEDLIQELKNESNV